MGFLCKCSGRRRRAAWEAPNKKLARNQKQKADRAAIERMSRKGARTAGKILGAPAKPRDRRAGPPGWKTAHRAAAMTPWPRHRRPAADRCVRQIVATAPATAETTQKAKTRSSKAVRRANRRPRTRGQFIPMKPAAGNSRPAASTTVCRRPESGRLRCNRRPPMARKRRLRGRDRAKETPCTKAR